MGVMEDMMIDGLMDEIWKCDADDADDRFF